MRGLKYLLAMTALSVVHSGAANAQKVLPTASCINTGNHLEVGKDAGLGNSKLTPDDFSNIRGAGFQSIRMPVNWSRHLEKDGSGTINAAWLDLVQKKVDEALAADLTVVMNSHYFETVHSDPDIGGKMLAKAWEQIALRFAAYPENRLFFEIENEPHDKLNNSNLMETLGASLTAIRASNPTRTVVIGGENWSGVDSLATLELPDDPNVHPTFHYYEPFDFTHQGASWVGDHPPPLGRHYGTDADRARLAADVEKVRQYITRTGKTPFMGENGAYEIVPMEERIAYHRAVADAFRPLGITPCIWAYTNTFPFYDGETHTWHPGLREATGINVAKDKGEEK